MQSRQGLRTTIAAALAAATLTLAAVPATAAERRAARSAGPRGLVEAVQERLGGWFAGWVSRAPKGELRNTSQKEGLGIDPDGKPLAPPPPSGGGSTGSLGTEGHCIDPNGRPRPCL